MSCQVGLGRIETVYPSPYYPRVPITIVFWDVHSKKIIFKIMTVCLSILISVARMHGNGKESVNIFVSPILGYPRVLIQALMSSDSKQNC